MTEEKTLSPETLVEEITNIIESRMDFCFSNYPAIRLSYHNAFQTPELDTWRHEVCLCLLFGLNQAAITATNHLLESFLKHALKYYFSRPWRNPEAANSPEGMMKALEQAQERVDNLPLENTIDRACSLGIILKEDKRELKRLKGPFRDAYSHASKRKLLGDAPVTVYPMTVTQEGQFQSQEPLQVPVGLNPLVGWQAQLNHAKTMAIPYFLYMDDLIRRTLSKLHSEQPPTPEHSEYAQGREANDDPRPLNQPEKK
jgi:hypothetical protein